jgi:flagellar assembly protein FliH
VDAERDAECAAGQRARGRRGAALANSGGDGMERFEYRACPGAPPLPGWDGWVEADAAAAEELRGESGSGGRGRDGDTGFAERLAEEARQSFAAGRERGREEGRSAEREAQAAALAAETECRRRQLAHLVESFAREQDKYLLAVEEEVVRLALAVAARVLRREAQMDPLLLTGAVRVALNQIGGAAEVRLRVPPQEADLWRETVALLPNLSIRPQVVAEEGMRLGECVIESRAGTVDVGMRAQLGEIERGFFDRARGQGQAAAAARDAAAGEARQG